MRGSFVRRYGVRGGRRVCRALFCWTIPAAVIVGACSESGSGAATSDGDFSAPVYAPAEQPTLLTQGEASQPFFSIRAARLMPAGLVVADGSETIVWIGDDGTVLRRFGGRGEGPGEFERIAELAVGGNGEIAAWDPVARRLTTFSRDGSVVAVTPLGPPSETTGRWQLNLAGILWDGRSVVIDRLSPVGPDLSSIGQSQVVRDTALVSAVEPATGVREVLARLPSTERFVAAGEGVYGGEPILFATRVFAAAFGDRVVFAANSSFELTIARSEGSSVVASFPLSPRPASPSLVEEARQGRLSEIEGYRAADRGAAVAYGGVHGAGRSLVQITADFRAGLIGELPHRDSLPVLGGLRAGLDGVLWIEVVGGLESGEHREWLALDQNLAPLKRVLLGTELEVLDLSTERVLVLLRDELDRESIAVFPLVEADEEEVDMSAGG